MNDAVPGDPELRLMTLGPIAASRDGVELDLGTPRQRAVLAAVALSDRAVSVDTVVERVWGAAAPAAAVSTVHGHIARLRRALEPDRPPRAPAQVLVTVDASYRLVVPHGALDEHRFEAAFREGRALLGPVVEDPWRPVVAPQDREQAEAALDALEAGLRLWRGAPYADLAGESSVVAHRVRLEELRGQAEELRAVALLALGRHDVALPELESRSTELPVHERWWALRAVALARSSRQAEALGVLATLRDHLADELGVDPSPPVHELQLAVLRQDRSVTDTLPPVAAQTAPAAVASRSSRWPWAMVGRESELTLLEHSLERAVARRPSFAVLTGEAGIGKTRLAEELVARAEERGVRTVTGRCSQDDGAPPLWPWLSVLSALGQPYAAAPGDDAGGLFRVRAEVAAAVLAAADRPLLVVLEDLHWADVSTLGVMRLLAEQAAAQPLMVVTTWRAGTVGGADLGGVAEVLARRHAVRLDLVGLEQGEAGHVFAEVAGLAPRPELGQELHTRTGGNPFFVVELARWAASLLLEQREPTIEGVLAGPPAAVADVINRRLAELPAATTTVLRSAAVVGRTFDLDTLARLTRIEPAQLLDLVEPAVRAGLLHEDAPELMRFGHALVRDVLYAAMTATRLARTHAAVAELLTGQPGREAEVATHWRAAGPGHRGRAWRASADAAAVAGRVHAFVEAGALLEVALELQADDERSAAEERVGLYRQLLVAYRWAAMLPELIGAVERLVGLAEELGDRELRAWAATQVGQSMLWRSAGHGEVNEVVTGALRDALTELPADRTGLRARVLATLAMELREVEPLVERARLCKEATALARDVEDPELLCDVLLLTAMTTWSPDNTEARLRLGQEAATLAAEAGYEHALVMGLTLSAVVLGELGRPQEMASAVARARQEADRLRVGYALLVLDELELAWLAAGGRADEVARLWAETEDRLTLMARSDDELGVDKHVDLCAVRTWQGQPLAGLPNLLARIEAGYPLDPLAVVARWRGGDRDGARRTVSRERLLEILDLELGYSQVLRCQSAEAALYLDLPDVAARAYELLAPHAGESSGADGLYYGPVDCFLALAARASGDTVAARRHADVAEAVIVGWAQPPVLRWFTDLRAEHDF